MNPGITGDTFGQAYRRAVDAYTDGLSHTNLTVIVNNAIDDVDDVPNSLQIDDWEEYLAMGDEWELLKDMSYQKESPKTGGSRGHDWVTDRILELQRDMYWERIEEDVEKITDRLQDGLHGSSTNALVAQVFGEDDLTNACVSRPQVSAMPCVTQVQFHPVKDKLHLHITLRSQYLDLKGLGNLVSAATLLTTVASNTGYTPGTIVEHVHNVTTYDDELMGRIQRTMEIYKANDQILG